MIGLTGNIVHRLVLGLSLLLVLVGGYGCSGDDPEQLFQQGIDAMEADNPSEAVIWFKKALQQNPEMAIAHYKLGEVYRKKGDARLAYAELSRALQQDPQLKDARKELVFLLVENRALGQVVKVCEDYLELNGNDEDIYSILGNSLAYSKKIAEAVKVLEDGLKVYPENIILKMNLAKMLVVKGDVEEGRAMMEALAEHNQDDIKVHIALAQLYEKIERFDLATLTLEATKEKFPANPLSYLSLAQLSLKKNHPDQAKQIILDAEQAGVKDTNLYRLFAMISHRQGKSPEALEYFEKAVEFASAEQRLQNLMILADYHTFLKNYKEAQGILETIIAEDSSKRGLKSKVVELFMAQGEFDQAKTSVDALLEEDSSDARGHFLKGLMLMQDKDVAEARKQFSRAKDLAPNAAENQFLYGVTFMDESEQISITEISEALKKNPNLLKARMALAELYVKKGELQNGLDELDKILAVKGESNQLDKITGKQADNVKVRILRIAILMKMKKPDAALEDARLLVEQQPGVSGHVFRLAEIYYSLREFENALPLYEALQKEKPESVQVLNRIVGVFMLQKEFEKALDAADSFLAKYPDTGQAVMVKAKIYLSQGHMDLAENILIPEVDKGKDAAVAVMLAGLYQQKKNIDKAIQYYQKALEIAPDTIGIMMKLADLYLKGGKNAEAIESYENVLKQKSDFIPAMNNLAFLYSEENKNLDRALELATTVYKKLPDNPNVADTLGWIYVMKNVYSQAEPYLQQALTAMPDNASINYHMGMLRYRQKQQQEAETLLTKAVEKGLSENEQKGAEEILTAIVLSNEKLQTALSLKDEGKAEQAIPLFEEILKDEGFNSDAAAALAVLYAEQNKDITKALELAQKAYDGQPNNPLAADALGWVYYYQGSLLMAKQYIEEALQADTSYGPAYLHLGAVYLKKEDPAAAKKEFESAKSMKLSAADRQQLEKLLLGLGN